MVTSALLNGVREGNCLANFTFHARKAYQLANQEAHHLFHDHLGAEHLLLGLVKVSIGLAPGLLRSLGCYLSPARGTVAKVAPATPELVTLGNLAWTAHVRETVTRATEQARDMGHPRVGTGHVLLAVLAESAATFAWVFADAAPDPVDVRVQLLDGLTNTNWAVVEEHWSDFYGPCPNLVRLN